MNPLQTFITDEMKRRAMSMREFATFIGVSHGTISRLLDQAKKTRKKQPAKVESNGHKDVGVSVEVLIKIARATNTKIVTLIAMAYPEVAEEVPPSRSLMADQFGLLPPQIQSVVLGIMRDWVAEDAKSAALTRGNSDGQGESSEAATRIVQDGGELANASR